MFFRINAPPHHSSKGRGQVKKSWGGQRKHKVEQGKQYSMVRTRGCNARLCVGCSELELALESSDEAQV